MIRLVTPPRSPGHRSGVVAFFRLCNEIIAFKQKHQLPNVRVYLVSQDAGLDLYMIHTQAIYDFSLCDQLSEFAAPYLERGLLQSAMLLPSCTDEELSAYFDVSKAILLEGVP